MISAELPKDLTPPSATPPLGGSAIAYRNWFSQQQQAQLTWRMACCRYAADHGDQFALRYRDGLEVHIGPSPFSDKLTFWATPFRNRQPLGHTEHPSAGAALVAVLASNVHRGIPVLIADRPAAKRQPMMLGAPA